MNLEDLKPNTIVRGPMFPEPVKVIRVVPMGGSIKLVGQGMTTGLVHQPILSPAQLASLEGSPEQQPFDGDATKFKLGVEALRLEIAYEYDPYFSLSIARVDPLPHQLEAVYDYFLRLPRIRFLLADDPGAGKTIMAGLLIKELKVRGLVKRILIVTPANLSFQWQRELKDKFQEKFEVVRSDVLRANYGSNPWQEKNQVVTSISWVSRIDDAKESLLRSHWDLIIVDEAHKMSAYSADKKTLAYELGEQLSEMTDHYLLMTATPHKGDKENFRLFLQLLDRDVYGDVASIDEAIRRHEAPFYLRRIKEALVHFPDPDTGERRTLFTKRKVETIGFAIGDEEGELYDALTRYVEDQSIKAAADNSARGRAVGFTMAMLQRRFASSVRAARRSLERMRDKRQQICSHPAAYRQRQIDTRLPDDFEDLTDEEQQEIVAVLEETVVSVDPIALQEEIGQLDKLVSRALLLEKREVESKLLKLREVLTQYGIFEDPKMKLLIFTEHKDTLDYLVEKMRDEWRLSVTQIHGGMKIGDRDTPGSRIYAEREFRESCQIMAATEAAGEGINLQFCWFMINYDIPWNPVRLEQRMGRIHRYLQEKDCLILNFVSTNTREGRVFHKLFERLQSIEADLDPQQTGKIFNVLGDVFTSNQLERMLREMYTRNLSEDVIKSRIVEQVDGERFRQITNSALEGLAKRSLNLSAIVGKSVEAKERRLVPEVVEDFFLLAGPMLGLYPKEIAKGKHCYRVGRVPKNLWNAGDLLEPRFGKLGKEYKQIVFDKRWLSEDPAADWVTPGHPLFEVVREGLLQSAGPDMERGSVFYDVARTEPARLDVYSAKIRDGLGNILHRRLFVVETSMDSSLAVRQPTLFLDMVPAPAGTEPGIDDGLPGEDVVEQALIEKALEPFLEEIQQTRLKEIETISTHMEISLKALIHRHSLRMAELMSGDHSREANPLHAANVKQVDDKIEELNNRLDKRRNEIERERCCTIADIQHHGRAWVLPHPDRAAPKFAAMVRDNEIEKIAINAVIAHEESRGWRVTSVETENRGFDLISRRPHPEDPETSIEVRFIEVKGRSGIGEVALTTNEFKTAERLKKDFWLYVVFNCASNAEIRIIQDPARLNWQALVKIEHYYTHASTILEAGPC